MSEYRAYLLGTDGHIQGRVDLDCADDSEAKERAKQLVDGRDVELWQLDRKIAMFSAPVPEFESGQHSWAASRPKIGSIDAIAAA